MPSSCATGRFTATPTSTRPRCSTPTLQLRTRPEVFFAGQISGVEGYVESIATGLMAGMHAAALAAGETPCALPRADRARLALPLRLRRRPEGLPARQHHLRPAARSSTKPIASACAATRRPATPWSAGARWRRSKSIAMPASELERQIARYLEELARAGNSEHSIRAYDADLRQFLAYLSPPDLAPPEPGAIDLLLLREWLAGLYRDELSAVTIRRKLAAVRGLFRFMLREGVVPLNVARLVRTPKAPKKLPEVMTAEQVNTLIDGVAARTASSVPFPRATAPSSNCSTAAASASANSPASISKTSIAPKRWLRVRGKGKKERQVPLPGQAAGALERYLGERAGGARRTRRLSQSPRRAPDHARHQRHRQALRHVSGGRSVGASAQLPPRLRHAPAGRWRRPARHPGTAGPRAPLHHAEVHPGIADRPDGGLRQGAPEGCCRMS